MFVFTIYFVVFGLFGSFLEQIIFLFPDLMVFSISGFYGVFGNLYSSFWSEIYCLIWIYGCEIFIFFFVMFSDLFLIYTLLYSFAVSR